MRGFCCLYLTSCLATTVPDNASYSLYKTKMKSGKLRSNDHLFVSPKSRSTSSRRQKLGSEAVEAQG